MLPKFYLKSNPLVQLEEKITRIQSQFESTEGMIGALTLNGSMSYQLMDRIAGGAVEIATKNRRNLLFVDSALDNRLFDHRLNLIENNCRLQQSNALRIAL